MVISLSSPVHSGTVSIPCYIADSTLVLYKEGSTYRQRTIQDGDWAMLVRQLAYMWSGGIQPVIVHVSPPSIEEDESWDVKCVA